VGWVFFLLPTMGALRAPLVRTISLGEWDFAYMAKICKDARLGFMIDILTR
jgi:hypothetical protein